MKKAIFALVVLLNVVFGMASVEAAIHFEWGNVSSVETELRKVAIERDSQEMTNGQEGCTEAAVLIGSSISPVLEEARVAGVVYNPTLISFVQERGISVVEFSNEALDPGDVIMFGNEDCSYEHAMIYIGSGDMAGNYSYLRGMDGQGGIWTTTLASYKTWKPMLILKTGAPYKKAIVSVYEDEAASADAYFLVVLFTVLLVLVKASLASRASSTAEEIPAVAAESTVAAILTAEAKIEAVAYEQEVIGTAITENGVEDSLLIQVAAKAIGATCAILCTVVHGRGDPPGYFRPRGPDFSAFGTP